MGKAKKPIIAKARGIAGADKRAEKQAWKKEKNQKRYGKVCNYNSQEEREFASILEGLGLQVRTIPGDGNCMFRSIADQLFGARGDHMDVRLQIANYMVKEKETFSLFVEDDEPFMDYINRMRTHGEWGGHQELYAAAQVFHVSVYVHQVDGPRFVVAGEDSRRNIHLSYHGEYHYNSIRAIDNNDDGPANEINLDSGDSSAKAESSREKPSKSSYDWREVQRALEEADAAEVAVINESGAETSTQDNIDTVNISECGSSSEQQEGALADRADAVAQRPKHVQKAAMKKAIDTKLGGISKKDKRKIMRELARGGSLDESSSQTKAGSVGSIDSSSETTSSGTPAAVVEIHL